MSNTITAAHEAARLVRLEAAQLADGRTSPGNFTALLRRFHSACVAAGGHQVHSAGLVGLVDQHVGELLSSIPEPQP